VEEVELTRGRRNCQPGIVELRDSRGWGLVTDTGVIATNHHVVENDVCVTVIFSDASE
jgi:S1-C subfamily serine protease